MAGSSPREGSRRGRRPGAAVLVLPLLASACLADEPAVVAVSRFALIPDSVSRLAATVVRPDHRDAMRCEADATVHDVETDASAAATADLFSEPIADAAELTGPAELTRGSADGAVVDGVHPGSVLVFAEGFDDSGRAVARACAGPAVVASGTTTDVELIFVEL
jgi:hypothetical protein